MVAEDEYLPHAAVKTKTTPEGKIDIFEGPMISLLNVLASNINFT